MAAAIGPRLAGPTRPLSVGSVAELIQRQALTRPDHAALHAPGHDHTFGQLWSGAQAWADTLVECGVQQGDLVALWADRTPDTIVAAVAVMLAGAACVPLEPTHPHGEDPGHPRRGPADPDAQGQPLPGRASRRPGCYAA